MITREELDKKFKRCIVVGIVMIGAFIMVFFIGVYYFVQSFSYESAIIPITILVPLLIFKKYYFAHMQKIMEQNEELVKLEKKSKVVDE